VVAAPRSHSDRRPALAESLARHARALGLTVLPDSATTPDEQDLVLADASSQREYLKARLGAGKARQRNLIVLATAAELDLPELAGLESQAVVLKPVQRGALYDASPPPAVARHTRGAGCGARRGPERARAAGGGRAGECGGRPGLPHGSGVQLGGVKDGAEAVARNAASAST